MDRNILISRIIGILIALMWAAAAFGKLNDMDQFRQQMGQSPLLQGLEHLLLWPLPIGELLLTVALLLDTYRQLACYVCVFLLSLFTAYILVLLQFSYYVPCACSGFASGLSWSGHILFNLLFLGLAVAGIFIQEAHQPVEFNRHDKRAHKILRNRARANPYN